MRTGYVWVCPACRIRLTVHQYLIIPPRCACPCASCQYQEMTELDVITRVHCDGFNLKVIREAG